ncbi:MAG: hypothetical protein ABF415_07485 [Leuconostoc pseudomesenteroides]|uniref:hypothetical protein n=1 Tax=Leuconostoc pseudomesenteroides TaxID=33968 RepID=UPI0039E92C5B
MKKIIIKTIVVALMVFVLWIPIANTTSAAITDGAKTSSEVTNYDNTNIGAAASDVLPTPHAVGRGNMYFLTYDESVQYVKLFDQHKDDNAWFNKWFDIENLVDGLNGARILRNRADKTTDAGFGVCWKLGSCVLGNNQWYCNDSWSTPTSACQRFSAAGTNKCPSVWDSTVPHYSELGNIATAFYGGWSCDYAGTSYGAKWAGIGKGHK